MTQIDNVSREISSKICLTSLPVIRVPYASHKTHCSGSWTSMLTVFPVRDSRYFHINFIFASILLLESITMSSQNDQANGNGATNGHVQDSFVDGSVAISPNMPELVPDLLKKVATHGISFISNDPKARTELLDAARSLVNAVETPREAMIRYCWSQVRLFSRNFACNNLSSHLINSQPSMLAWKLR